MRYLASTAIIALFSLPSLAKTMGPPVEIEVSYGSAIPFANDGEYNEGALTLRYDTSDIPQKTYFALDASYSEALENGYGLAALRVGTSWEKHHFGTIAGLSIGEVSGKFLGFEWGYTGERMNVDIRGSHWRLDGAASNVNRLDARAEYRIWRGVSAFYDYTHQFATKDGFKGDEFLYGINYAFGGGRELELGMGNVHPQDTLTGESKVWTQYMLTYRFNFGRSGRTDPIDLPNFYDY